MRLIRIGLRSLFGFGLVSLGWMLTATALGAFVGLPMLALGIELLTGR